MDVDKHIVLSQQSSKGKVAEHFLTEMDDFFDDRHRKILNNLLATYRASTMDKDKIIGLVGQLATLEDMKQTLVKRVKQGQHARKELTDAASPE